MPFRNYSLTKGGQLVIPQIFSPDFVTGESGWKIGKDGSAEFNNASFRGKITATELDALVQVLAGVYAGAYTVKLAELTDADSNQLAVLSWQNSDHPGTVPPYLAAVTSGDQGSGSLANLTSGQAESDDAAAAIWVLSVKANDGTNTQFLVDADQVALFGGDGPLMSPSGDGFLILIADNAVLGLFSDELVTAVPVLAADPSTGSAETWHEPTLASGWTQDAGNPIRYRLLPTGNVQWSGIATHAGFTTTQTLIASLDSNYVPAHSQEVPAGIGASVATGIAVSSSGVVQCRANVTGSTTTTCAPQGSYPLD